jgi:hypothetical protein
MRRQLIGPKPLPTLLDLLTAQPGFEIGLKRA